MPPPPATTPNPRRPSAREQGSISLWLLCVAVMLLFIGGISLDLWRVFTERQALANAADAAAIAGGSGIDEAYFRQTGDVRLDPARAESMARQHLEFRQNDTQSLVSADVSATTEQISVTLTGEVEFTLLRVLLPDGGPFPIEVTAVASPEESL